jgi:site-specific recombinase XerD
MADLDPDTRRFLDGVRARGASPETVRAYAGDLRDYRAFLAERRLEPREASRADVRAYAASLGARGLAPAARARRLSAVRTFHRRLQTAGATETDPAAELPGPRRDRRLPDVVPAREAAWLLDAPWPDGPLGLRDRALFELLYGCGLRVSEVCDLDLGALSARELRVRGKGARTRLVPLGGPAQDAVTAWLARGRPALAGSLAGEALLLSIHGRRLEPSAVRRA